MENKPWYMSRQILLSTSLCMVLVALVMKPSPQSATNELIKPSSSTGNGEATKKLILVGETGVGKSAFGNEILGEEKFQVGHSLESCTEHVEEAGGWLFGKVKSDVQLSISDTGGLGDTQGRDDKFVDDIISHIRSIGGVHGFIFVLNACQRRLHKQSRESLRMLIETVTSKQHRGELGPRFAFVMTQCTSSPHRILWNELPGKICDITDICYNFTMLWYDDFGLKPKESIIHRLPIPLPWLHPKESLWRSEFRHWIHELDNATFHVPSADSLEKKKEAFINQLEAEEKYSSDLQKELNLMKRMKKENMEENDRIHSQIRKIESEIREHKRKTWEEDGCFSGASLVVDRNLGPIHMKDLELGSQVKVGHDRWSKVTTFLHYHPDRDTSALQVLHSDGSLNVTANHFIFILDSNGKKHAVTASQLRPGDTLLTETNTTMVHDIIPIMMEGYYAPITAAGFILVDGVIASCYTRHGGTQLPHWLVHMLATPLRLPYLSSMTPAAGKLHSIIQAPITVFDGFQSIATAN